MGRKHYRSSLIVAAALALSFAPIASGRAQYDKSGDGFLFGKPAGTLTLRLGYDLANANSEVYQTQRRDLTIGSRGFDGLTFGLDVGVPTTQRIDLGFTVDGNTRSRQSEYRAWEDNNNQPITQRTTLSMVALSLNLRYNLYDRGREISNFAWIPSSYLPYVGIGGGFQYYQLEQKGDFVDFSSVNKDINTDRLFTDGWGKVGQAFVGVQRNVTPHVDLTVEGRYTLSTADLHQDYDDPSLGGKINLSGFAFTVGTTIRF
jgi:opacity protein-like surface antigen